MLLHSSSCGNQLNRYVEQTPTMFAGTIRENILYGCPTATDEQVEKAARQANVSGF